MPYKNNSPQERARPLDEAILSPEVLRRFWKFVQVTEGCWSWVGSTINGTYGQIKIAGRIYASHRISWVIHNGSIPRNRLVCHHCDNPNCVRPDHLFIGTHNDNMNDMDRKSRRVMPPMESLSSPGESNPNARLKRENIITIRELLRKGAPQKTVARFFGVSQFAISLIYRRKLWSSLT